MSNHLSLVIRKHFSMCISDREHGKDVDRSKGSQHVQHQTQTQKGRGTNGENMQLITPSCMIGAKLRPQARRQSTILFTIISSSFVNRDRFAQNVCSRDTRERNNKGNKFSENLTKFSAWAARPFVAAFNTYISNPIFRPFADVLVRYKRNLP